MSGNQAQAFHGEFDSLLVFDWNSTLGYPGIKRTFFRKYGLIEEAEFNRRFDDFVADHHAWADLTRFPLSPIDQHLRCNELVHQLRSFPGTRQPAVSREARLLFLSMGMAHDWFRNPDFEPREPAFVKADGSAPDGSFTVDDIADFGILDEVYPGVEDTFVRIKRAVQALTGERVGVAVITNAWAPTIRNTPLVTNGAVDIVIGQEFADIRLANGKTVAAPVEGVGADTKPFALVALRKLTGVSLRRFVYAGNGYSDLHAFAMIKRWGGRTAGILHGDRINLRYGIPMTPKQILHEAEDERMLTSFLHGTDEQGPLVDFIVDADYTLGAGVNDRGERTLEAQFLLAAMDIAWERRSDNQLLRPAVPFQRNPHQSVLAASQLVQELGLEPLIA